MDIYEKYAKELWDAEKNGEAVEQISSRSPELDIDDAYKIQSINIDKKLKAGAKITGKKIGLTSLAMQESIGVDQPDYGILLDTMEIVDNTVKKDEILQPRVEGEFVFVLKEDLNGDVTAEEVLKATDYVVPAIEVVGSRVKDWKVTIVDTVADNASCGMYLLSDEKIDPNEIALKDIEMKVYKNEELINSGFGSAVLDDPVNAVIWLARSLGRYGITLNKGDVVLAGALTAAIPAESGDEFLCDFGEFGKVSVNFE